MSDPDLNDPGDDEPRPRRVDLYALAAAMRAERHAQCAAAIRKLEAERDRLDAEADANVEMAARDLLLWAGEAQQH